MNVLTLIVVTVNQSGSHLQGPQRTKLYGRELLQLCKSCNLVTVNGRVQSDKDGNFTGVGTIGKSVVEYLIVNRNSHHLFNFSVSRNLLESDYRALCFNISCNMAKIYEQSKSEVPSTPTNLEQRECFIWYDDKSNHLTECLFDEIGMSDFNLFWETMEKIVKLTMWHSVSIITSQVL